jgi:hypothetical protein
MTTTRHARRPHPHAAAQAQAAVDAAGPLGQAVLDALGEMPRSALRLSTQPEKDSQRAARSPATKAAMAAGTLALPLGPLGWLTVLPEMVTVWRIQARLVADIAALHGRTQGLTKEELLYCMFRHSAGQLVRDLVVRMGERSLVHTAGLQALRLLAQRIGARLARAVAGKSVARWLPVAGAVGMGAYAFWDTRQVAATATDLFASEVIIEALPDADSPSTLLR